MANLVYRRRFTVEWGHCGPAGIVFNSRFFEFFYWCVWPRFESVLGVSPCQLGAYRAAISRLRVWRRAYRWAYGEGLRTSRLLRPSLSLAFDLRFEDLYGRDGLVRLDGCFVDFLKRRTVELHNRLMTARAAPDRLADEEESDLIVELAPELEDFIAALFGLARAVDG